MKNFFVIIIFSVLAAGRKTNLPFSAIELDVPLDFQGGKKLQKNICSKEKDLKLLVER